MTVTEKELFCSLQIHDKKLTPGKKNFVLTTLSKHGIVAAFKALYIMLFIVKDEKELLTYKL